MDLPCLCLLRKTSAILILLIYFGCNSPEPLPGDMDTVFSHVSTTTLAGSKEAPLFSPGTPLISDDKIYLPDYIGKKVLIYNRNGEQIDTWHGDESSGLTFSMPYNIAQDNTGNIYVNDRQSGQLVVFDPSGIFRKVIPLSGQQNEHAMIYGNSVFVTGLSSPSPRSDRGKLIQKYTLDGEEAKVFAKRNPDTVVFSWATDIDEDGNIYLANILMDRIEIYSPNGGRRKTLKLSSPSFNLLRFDKEPATEEEFYLRRRLISETEYTKIRSMRILNGRIYLQLHCNNAPLDEPEFILDVFDTAGHLLYYGIETPGYLLPTDNSNLFFLEADHTGYGNVTIREYAFK